jgi:hypothetical protein
MIVHLLGSLALLAWKKKSSLWEPRTPIFCYLSSLAVASELVMFQRSIVAI